jgi:hypothetical protein
MRRDRLVVSACVAHPVGEHSPGWFGHNPGRVRLDRAVDHGSTTPARTNGSCHKQREQRALCQAPLH